jgi:hypothetical protein
MSEHRGQTEEITPDLSQKIVRALQHYKVEAGELEIAEHRAVRRGQRLYVRVRPANEPPAMYAFYHAVAGAEIEVRDQGLDIELTPEYRQKFIVVAELAGDSSRYIYESQEGAEYDDLAKLLGFGPAWDGREAKIEGYPFEDGDERESALREASKEYPEAKRLS